MERKYVPSWAELIDRLTIVVQKVVYAETDEMRDAFVMERDDIIADINSFIKEGVVVDGESIHAMLMLQLVNGTIWANEGAARGDGENANYAFTHSLNYDRSLVKKFLQQKTKGRIDHKLNYSKGAWDMRL